MDDLQAIKSEMRVYVLEVLVVNLLALVCLQVAPDDPAAAVKKIADQMAAGSREQTFAALRDPALSDLYSAELEASATRLTDMASAQIDLILKARKERAAS